MFNALHLLFIDLDDCTSVGVFRLLLNDVDRIMIVEVNNI